MFRRITSSEIFRNKTEQWKRFWIQLMNDYKEVAVDTIRDIKTKPLKASKYFTAIGLATTAISLNPTKRDFIEKHVEATDTMVLVNSLIKNPVSEKHVDEISSLLNSNRLRHLNLVFLSVLWQDNYNPEAGIFESQCDYLKPSIREFRDRVVDVGFWGKWWIYEEKMKDFDISPSEWIGKS